MCHAPQAAAVPFALVFTVVTFPRQATAPLGRGRAARVPACLRSLFSTMGPLLCLGCPGALAKQAAVTNFKQPPAKRAEAAVQRFQSLGSHGPAT